MGQLPPLQHEWTETFIEQLLKTAGATVPGLTPALPVNLIHRWLKALLEVQHRHPKNLDHQLYVLMIINYLNEWLPKRLCGSPDRSHEGP